MAATEVASLMVTIGGDVSGLKNGLKTANQKVGNFGQKVGEKLSNIGGGFQNLGGAITIATAPLALGFAAGITAAASFETSMAEIQARTGLTATEMQRVSDFALQMGADTMFSGQQAADAMLQLLSSGQDVNEAMATLPAVMTLAAAGSIGLGLAADATTDIMSQFGLEVSEANTVVDALATASGASSANVDDMIGAFSNVGPVAAQMGLDVTTAAAALAVMAENGIKAEEAGTQLKSLLLNLNSDTAAAALTELGVALYDTEGNTRDFQTVIAELDTALENLPAQEQTRLMKELGGAYGITALAALTGSLSIGEMETRMANSASAADIAAAKMDTFAGKMDGLGGSVETLMITALTPLMNDVLKPLVEEATKVVNQFTAWAEANPQLAQGVVAIAGAATIAGPILIAVGTAFKFIGIAVAALTSPLALIAAGIGTIIALAPRIPEGIATWAENFRNLGAIVETVFTDIARRVAVAVSDITRGIQTKIAELQVSVLQGQALLGTADPAAVQRAIDDLATLYSADKINAALEAQIGSQDIDLSQMISFTLPGGATFSHSIATILAGVDPSIMGEGLKWQIEDAIKTAIATADTTDLPALLLAAENFGIELDPAVIQSQIVTQVQAAIASGDQEGYLALMQLALQLGLNPQEIQQQATTQTVTAVEAITPQAQVGITVISNVISDVAGQVGTFLGGLPYSATATASIFINPLVQFTQSIQSIISNMIAGMNVGGGEDTGTDVPQHRYGSDYTAEGLAYLHEGERVLTRQENREFSRGGMGGSVTTILNVNAMGTPYQMAGQIRRAYNTGGRGR